MDLFWGYFTLNCVVLGPPKIFCKAIKITFQGSAGRSKTFLNLQGMFYIDLDKTSGNSWEKIKKSDKMFKQNLMLNAKNIFIARYAYLIYIYMFALGFIWVPEKESVAGIIFMRMSACQPFYPHLFRHLFFLFFGGWWRSAQIAKWLGTFHKKNIRKRKLPPKKKAWWKSPTVPDPHNLPVANQLSLVRRRLSGGFVSLISFDVFAKPWMALDESGDLLELSGQFITTFSRRGISPKWWWL